MLKSWLVTILILAALAGAYYLDLFGLLASRGAFITASVLVAAGLLAALKILGNPFRKVDDDDDSKQ